MTTFRKLTIATVLALCSGLMSALPAHADERSLNVTGIAMDTFEDLHLRIINTIDHPAEIGRRMAMSFLQAGDVIADSVLDAGTAFGSSIQLHSRTAAFVAGCAAGTYLGASCEAGATAAVGALEAFLADQARHGGSVRGRD